ncbi:MAG TPA: DinB family protein [Chryseolinea sp.]|nr:DinB family protein [Chryseolinea sp.]
METLTKSSESLLFSQTFLKAWTLHLKRFGALIEELDDETLARQTAPGRNSGTYLLGHLVAVHDGMYSLLGFGQRLHPEYDDIFLKARDSAAARYPALSTLRTQWAAVNVRLTEKLEEMAPHEWLDRHAAVSEADFEKEPNRNKFNVLVTRLTHLNYHWGQLVYLKENSHE